jgi:hypothetical protein
MAIVIELNTPSNLKEGDVALIKEINAGLCRLKAQRVDQIKVEGRLIESKLAWKLAVYREAVLWRVVALTESVALNWNSDNIVGAYLPARAMIETSALLLDLEHELKKHIAARDIAALNTLLNSRTFATRDKNWIEDPRLGVCIRACSRSPRKCCANCRRSAPKSLLTIAYQVGIGRASSQRRPP